MKTDKTSQLLWFIFLILGIWLSIETVNRTFYGLELVLCTAVIGLAIGLTLHKKRNTSELWSSYADRRSFLRSLRRTTYMFLCLAVVGFASSYILVGETVSMNVEITDKRINKGKSTSYILAIAPEDLGPLDLKVGEDFWNSQSVGDILMIVLQENIIGFYVVTDYSTSNNALKQSGT
jgi:hypothetical protein